MAGDQAAGKKIPLGYISGVHGVKGWVKVFSYTQPKEAILEYQPWFVGDQTCEVIQGRTQGQKLVAQLQGIDTRDQAVELIRQEISVYRNQLADLDDGEYYWTDLEGLDVYNKDGQHLGQVDRIMATGANDVLIVKGDRERLIPFVQGQYITAVDIESSRLDVDWDPEF